MNGRALRSLLVAAAALGSGSAGALEAAGWIGGSATRLDTWSPPHDSSDQLRLDAGLNAIGYLFSPEDIVYGGNLQYGRNRASFTGAQSDENMLTYGGSVSAFDNRRSNYALQLSGGRSQSDLSQSSATSALTGASVTNSFSAGGRAGGGLLPGISVGASWTDSTNSGLDRPDLRRTTKSLDATASHASDGYSYQLSYRGVLDEGSVPALDYLSQTMGFGSKAQLSESTELGLFGQHFTRSPRVDDGTNPRYDDTNLGASTWTTLPGLKVGTRYTYGHFLFESSTAPATERFTHALGVTAHRPLNPEWTIAPSVSVSYTQDRLGTDESTAAGQNLGLNATYVPARLRGALAFDAGARVGLLEPAGGSTEMAWGGTVASRYNGARGVTSYSASYRLDYDTNTNAIAGWSLAQALGANLSRPLTGSMSLASSLLVATSRTSSPQFGDGASRSAQISAGVQWPSYSLNLVAAASDGVSGALASPVRGDALFVPPDFQTHSRTVAFQAAANLQPRWTLFGAIRYGSISAPDVPTQNELAYTARIGYRIGQFVLSAEDIYRTGGASGPDVSVNQVMVTFARNFHL